MTYDIEIVKMALKLMEIEYDNWNTCLEHCSSIRGDRHGLSYYVKKVKEETESLKLDRKKEAGKEWKKKQGIE